MKKFFALALALVLTFAMAVTCFAATGSTTVPAGDSREVVINYVAGSTAPATYAVDIAFESMAFTYNAAAKSWDAENPVEVENAGGWEGNTSAKITVTNHSNVAIKSTIAYAAAATTNGTVVATLDGGTETTLAAATEASAPKQEATLTITGTPELAAESTTFTLGTVTVTIAAAPQ